MVAKQTEYNRTKDEKDEAQGLTWMPRCKIPKKDVEFFRGLATIIRNQYLRHKND